MFVTGALDSPDKVMGKRFISLANDLDLISNYGSKECNQWGDVVYTSADKYIRS